MNRGIPQSFTVGDTVTWRETFSLFPAPAWTLNYTIRSRSYQVTQASTPDADVHVMTLNTAPFQGGRYQFQKYVEDGGGGRVTVGSGGLTVHANLATGPFEESFARKALDAIEAAMLRRATKAQRSFTIDGTSIENYSPQDLLVLYDRFKAMVANEENAAALADGLGNSRKIQVRFAT